MPVTKKEGGSGRRRSISLFSKGALAGLTPLNTNISAGKTEDAADKKKDRKKLSTRSSLFHLNSSTGPEKPPDPLQSPVERPSSPKPRPRTLHKSRPTSIFGSLGRKSGSYADEKVDNIAGTPESPPLELGGTPPLEQAGQGRVMGKTVLHHGEVQTQSGLFRKKKEYLVLTDTHLIRFKSQARAFDAFPAIPPTYGKTNTARHASTTSVGSLQDAQSTQNSQDSGARESRIPLDQVVAAYMLEDGRPFFTTEVVYLDEDYHGVGSVQLMLHDPKDADLWHTSIRAAAQKAKLLMPNPYPERVVKYLISALEIAQDYHNEHFQIFRVVRRAAVTKGNKSATDDVQKVGATVFYLVIGLHRIHLVPLPEFGESSPNLTSKAQRDSYGILSLTAINVQHSDDRFDLTFRTPVTKPLVLELAGPSNTDIAVFIFKAWVYLKPLWTDLTFTLGAPRGLLERVDHYLMEPDDEFGGFSRTLTAYCNAYGCNPINIRYGVDEYAEDAPEWRLYSPATTATYSTFELLAIFRALRYNDHFRSISFRDIDLQSLYGQVDKHGIDHIAFTSLEGYPIKSKFNIPYEGSLLYQEVQALALKSRVLRRLDFTNSLPLRVAKDTFDFDEETTNKTRNQDPGCEIVAGLFPICRAELTHVDWVILSGIELGETDLDFLTPALNHRKSRMRGIETARCGLNNRLLNTLMMAIDRQCATLECLNISDNPGRLETDRFHDRMTRYQNIRKLDLSRTPRSRGDAPLITPAVLQTWHLEELYLNGITVNEATLEAIAGYLIHDASKNLRILQMDQCSLSGSDVACLMRSMTPGAGMARRLQLEVSNNRLEKGIDEIANAIQENHTPSHLVMRMIEFSKEDHFKRLLEALRTNTTIQMLDISKASLPYDAGPETCDALHRLFAENTTLEELDISGEQSHLEVTRFGIGLNSALTGLVKNNTLKVLRIEYQSLGLEGANTLSSVLEANKGLEEVYCDHNNISLQGFTILVNALANNFSVQYMPEMRGNQAHYIRETTANYKDTRKAANHSKSGHVPAPIRKLNHLGKSKSSKHELAMPEAIEIVRGLEDGWQKQVDRLNVFLYRNTQIAEGGFQAGDGLVPDDIMRPTTAMSERGILEQIISNTTPRIELANPVDDHFKIPVSEIVEAVIAEEKYIDVDMTPTRNRRGPPSMLPEVDFEKLIDTDDDESIVFPMDK